MYNSEKERKERKLTATVGYRHMAKVWKNAKDTLSKSLHWTHVGARI